MKQDILHTLKPSPLVEAPLRLFDLARCLQLMPGPRG